MKTSHNIELKAKCDDLVAAATRAMEVGAQQVGELTQIDTYFHAPHGRLKLREIEGQAAQLIWYDRPNSVEFRASQYYVVPVSDAETMKAALSAAMGLRLEVRKRRDLLMYENVRIHLDRVEGLGTFVEFEAVIAAEESESTSVQRLVKLQGALRIKPDDGIDVSYSDLLERKRAHSK